MPAFAQPRVIVRLREDPACEGLEPLAYLQARDPASYRRVTAAAGKLKLTSVFSEKSRKRLPELQKLASRRDPSYRAEPLTGFYYVEADDEHDLVKLARLLASSAAVQSADVESPGPDPLVDASDDVFADFQDYLDVAPGGIDARYAWTVPGGDGAGQTIIDIEQGWTLNHEDLAAHGATQLNGVLVNGSRAHGTGVLGEICAIDNNVGCVGIAPNVATVFVASRNPSLANSIVDVLDNLHFGDVMLLETQDAVPGTNRQAPSEIVEVTRAAIRLATALGIIVVEAGGNGTGNGGTPATNLDTFTDSGGKKVLWRSPGNNDFQDSGAIIVSAATSAAPHTRLAYATHGLRIDCYGWGENVATCSSDAAGATNLYTLGFNGTSSASPIVAGAALCVQGAYQAATGHRLSPRQMRQILSDPAHNTPPAASETTAMGVMPNLRGIIDGVLGLVPDVYLRDNLSDTGAVHSGAISWSPDIIVRQAAVGNSQAAFGEGSGTENDDTLSDEVKGGQDNFVYVRCRNRGSAAAANVSAQVFWSPPATLVTPDLWTPVGAGSVALPSVPAGNMLTCSPALTWPEASLPPTGHYCFVALLGSDGDAAPQPADFMNFDNYRTFIRNNNNVTWRNFNVIDADPSLGAVEADLPWIMPGAPDRTARFALELALNLPRGAEVLLEMPLRFLRRFKAQLELVEIDDRRDRALARLPAHGRLRFGPALIPAKARYAMRFRVRFEKARSKGLYRIEARQLLDGKEEVGRLAWQFDPNLRARRERQAREMEAAGQNPG
jgi:hypothetical protein